MLTPQEVYAGRTDYLQAFSNLKKAVQMYFFKRIKSTAAMWITSERVGYVRSEVVEELSRNNFTLLFSISTLRLARVVSLVIQPN